QRVHQTAVDGVLIGRGAQGNPWLFRGKAVVKHALRLGTTFMPLEEPIGLAERFRVVIEHSDHFAALHGRARFVAMRKHLIWYCRGFRGAADLRTQMARTNSPEEVGACLAAFQQNQGRGTAADYSSSSRKSERSTGGARRLALNSMRLILASTSPRRSEILSLLGVPFEVIAPDFEERVSAQAQIEEEVVDFALGKARSVAIGHAQSIVIGSDTMILIDREKLGKPLDAQDARRMLRLLAGRRHNIFTSVGVVSGNGAEQFATVEKVSVQMRSYGEGEITDYLACGESLDKAGAYSIQGQGGNLIETIEGDYLAAVGMPLKPVASYLAALGLRSPRDIDELYETRNFLNWRSFQ
ncbi:MAG TPA: Maf family nucleotide pyrophosphatase, partial [Terriglobales bacterium]|nr:Maf family nucleotide pyrophosphatase [Terriglobales bacterium]